jgi:3-hydroxybutyryl-CoA dehydrogenase
VREIRTIAVISAGAAGRHIAEQAALGGFRTILEDILPASLRRAESEIRNSLDEAVQAGHVTRADADTALSRLEFATSLEDAAREADAVIEAVPDEFDSKEEIFRLLDRICRPGTLLVASSLSIRVSDIAAITERPADIVGMRFHRSAEGAADAIEVVPATHTSEENVQRALAVARRMTADPVLLPETAEIH